MKRYNLCGEWKMTGGGHECVDVVPGSVYSFLLKNGLMADPYYRDNELEATKIMENDFTFSRKFLFSKPSCNRVLLCCDGLDTLCELSVNGVFIAKTDNMHRSYEFDITDALKDGENEIKALFLSPNKFMREMHRKAPERCIEQSMKGFPHIRKASCMMGWDWGPRLPDAGIWRDIYLLEVDSDRITDFHITQRHEKGRVFLTPTVVSERGTAEIKITLTTPEGNVLSLTEDAENEIINPHLWWPNGYGEQPLYKVLIELIEKGKTVDEKEIKIGLRTLRLVREEDEYGQSFCHEVNGVRIFAMGTNYVPEDNILSRLSRERTEKLLKHAVAANNNVIRVWGGGIYPPDYFFEICDELGLLVFQDLMFACLSLPRTPEMLSNISAEVRQNLARIRHHACLACVCGNNEIEIAMDWWKGEGETERRATYIKVFERLLPSIAKEVCPEIDYTTSSPTAHGGFIDTRNYNIGDSHIWRVWHENYPFTEFRNHKYRYLSEFGMASVPNEKTVNEFTAPEDRNLMSRVMELHFRDFGANGKLLTYLSNYFLYPNDFGTLIYATQLLQAEAVRTAVEHLRANRGRCMGTLIWQLNDIYPVSSWAAIDSSGRYRALQYAARRFYAPVAIACEEIGEFDSRPYICMQPDLIDYQTTAKISVTNETMQDISGTVFWELRNADAEILQSGSSDITVAALSAYNLPVLDFNKTDVRNNYISFCFVSNGETVSSGTAIFTRFKHYDFKNPNLRYEIEGDEITVCADAYAKYVEIDSPDSDFVLSDNYFDMNGGKKKVKILEGTPKTIRLRSVYDIR